MATSGDKWATFDCYGTLIDWNGGLRATLSRLWPDADPERLLASYHAVEPEIQAGQARPYRDVMRRSLAAVAKAERLELPPGRENALGEALPEWRPFPEVPAALETVRARGWKLAILSNTDPDLLRSSVARIGVPFELLITVSEAGSYKPAHGHWRRFGSEAGSVDAHVHVAASAFHDLAPCAELGLPAIWINRLDERSELSRAAELADLSGLADTLDAVPAGGGGAS